MVNTMNASKVRFKLAIAKPVSWSRCVILKKQHFSSFKPSLSPKFLLFLTCINVLYKAIGIMHSNIQELNKWRIQSVTKNMYNFNTVWEWRGLLFSARWTAFSQYSHVRAYLNKNLSNRWIGWRGAVEWLPHSPILTPLFFGWARIKVRICLTKPSTGNQVETETDRGRNEIPKEIIRCIWDASRY